MKTIRQNYLKNWPYWVGILLLLVSLFVFMAPEINFTKQNDNMTLFFINYLLSFIYLVIIWAAGIIKIRDRIWLQNIEYILILLLMFLVSAYSLNREMEVFNDSTQWLQYFLVIQGALYISLYFKSVIPKAVQVLLFVLLGISYCMQAYLTIYLIPLYPIGIVGSFFMGITLHSFVPLLILIILTVYLFRNDNKINYLRISFFAGIVIAVIVTAVHTLNWVNISRSITHSGNMAELEENTELPKWVKVSQSIPDNMLTERFLKSGLVYATVPDQFSWDFMPSRNFGDTKEHDPLIVIASLFSKPPSLTREEQIKILETFYSARHQAQERLWSGRDLETSNMITNVRIFPDLRIAYTEKTVFIKNTSNNSWSNQEAIYTFQMPEGSVVTSLSLWINGKEEKAILTSKQKADSAYRTIVGYEQRDPSLVRWQEGNTVSVRVFPCATSEDRKFKIGFSSPLILDQNNVVYENIKFQGPFPYKSEETIKLQFTDNTENLSVPGFFKNNGGNTFYYDGKYKGDWAASFAKKSIPENSFSFKGSTYRVSELQKQYMKFTPTRVYLDLNEAWSKKELSEVVNLFKKNTLFAYGNSLINIEIKNIDDVYKIASGKNFSLFPFHLIKEVDNSLVITKGTSCSLNVSDLQGSEFGKLLIDSLQNKGRIKVFNLGTEISPFIRSLRELRVFDYERGGMLYLKELIDNNKFAVSHESDLKIDLHDAGLSILKSQDTLTSNAPDHLMRLFAYNNVMRKTGIRYFSPDFTDTWLVEEADFANVVSPLTSLVVLETRADYDRFQIKDSNNGLQNASMKGSGSVPEPHEWMLILLLVCIIVYFIKFK
jgi:XrtN system VIT domain protein